MFSASGKCLKEFNLYVLTYGYYMIDMACSYTSITEFYNLYIFDFVQCFVGVYIHKFVDKSVCISDLGIMKHSSESCELFQEAEGK